MDPELTRKVEAVLFASGRFMDAKHLADLLEANPKHVTRACEALQQSYADQGSALRVVNDESAWKLHVRDDYLDLVSRIISDKEVSGPVLETLAVIAWRSPLVQAELIHIRGSNAYEHVKELVERGFVVKEPEGRSFRLRITEKFFEYFDIEGREDIRKVFREVEEAHREQEVEIELAQKRLEKAMRRAEEGESAVVDIDEPEPHALGEEATGAELIEEGKKLKKVSIDDLDKVLEKSQRTREKIAGEMASLRKAPEEEVAPGDPTVEGESEDDDTLDETYEKSKRIREDVERQVDEEF